MWIVRYVEPQMTYTARKGDHDLSARRLRTGDLRRGHVRSSFVMIQSGERTDTLSHHRATSVRDRRERRARHSRRRAHRGHAPADGALARIPSRDQHRHRGFRVPGVAPSRPGRRRRPAGHHHRPAGATIATRPADRARRGRRPAVRQPRPGAARRPRTGVCVAAARAGALRRVWLRPELLELAAARLESDGVPSDHLTVVGGALDGVQLALRRTSGRAIGSPLKTRAIPGSSTSRPRSG